MPSTISPVPLWWQILSAGLALTAMALLVALVVTAIRCCLTGKWRLFSWTAAGTAIAWVLFMVAETIVEPLWYAGIS